MYDVTSPNNHITIKTIAIVPNIGFISVADSLAGKPKQVWSELLTGESRRRDNSRSNQENEFDRRAYHFGSLYNSHFHLADSVDLSSTPAVDCIRFRNLVRVLA